MMQPSDRLATVSHQFRTPLSIIVGYTDLLLDDAGNGLKDEQREMLQSIQQQSWQLLELIQGVLDANRSDASHIGA